MDTHRDLHPPSEAAAGAPRQLLPIEAYTSDEWFRSEQKTLFAKSWLFAGMAEDFPENGSYRVIDAAGASLILLRDHEGKLRRSTMPAATAARASSKAKASSASASPASTIAGPTSWTVASPQ